MNKEDVVKKLKERGVEPEELDELVHEAASSMASNANNSGVEAQVEFLMNTCGWGADDIIGQF
jgi:hypothetical protein